MRAVAILTFATSLALGCAGSRSSGPRTISSSNATTLASSQQVIPQLTSSGECIAVELFENGEAKGSICVADAQAKGLTIVDLTDQWTPTLFAPTPDGQTPAFRDRYLELAQENADDDLQAKLESYAELYGVVPSLAIVRARLADEERHACNAAIDPKPVLAIPRMLSQDDKDRVAAIRRRAPLGKLQIGLVAAQQRLHCEGWLSDKDVDGTFTWRMGMAVEAFQRRNFLMPTARLDKETRLALQLDSHELDYRLALRVLRERVVEAAGLIEDGTAGTGPMPVLGRELDPPAMRAARGHKPMANAAPDLVGAATEAAARQLGWTDPARTLAFLDKYGAGVRVAIALPPLPAYYSPHMELSAVLDRGDVFYDPAPPKVRRKVAHRPTLVLYVQDGAIQRPLVRWPTTIGGWADQRLPSGQLVQRWKESDVGPRVWKTLTAGPAWMPPKSTPDRDLVKNLYNGHWALKSELLGPGPRAAYGMMLLEHVQVVTKKDGTERFDDNGIGTHGSSSVTSIVNGTSHGCHRLFNQLAVRLADFLLQHRTHTVLGELSVGYRRTVVHNSDSFRIAIDSRGFQYELDPPVPIDVTKGKILSRRKTPPKASAPARP
ncbi:MAG: peptidoglycan-binding protein [Kofleriaceae bacterium]|nr:peptidoglycan-binding protein [Kofleriaceae bacterium]